MAGLGFRSARTVSRCGPTISALCLRGCRLGSFRWSPADGCGAPRALSLGGRGEGHGDVQEPTVLDSGLHVVSTPVGNLEDVTLRALKVLRRVACVYAEDTRRTQKLFNAFEVKTPLLSCHAHNEQQRGKQIVERISLGEV